MHSVWAVYTLFITVKIVSQSQQMRAKKKKSRKRELINVDAEPKHHLSWYVIVFVDEIPNFIIDYKLKFLIYNELVIYIFYD